MVKFQSSKESGNIFWILGAARNELQKQRRITDYNIMRDRVCESKSYEEALKIIREYVELIDLDGKF